MTPSRCLNTYGHFIADCFGTARSSPKAAVVIKFEARADSHLISLICCFNISRMARAT